MDKLIFCAAGTLNAGSGNFDVMFPANLFNTLAVTGIKEPASYPGPLTATDEKCDICVVGDKVDFVVIMQRSGDDNEESTAVTIGCDGNEPVYTTGSSAATATMAGMAALVWEHKGVDSDASQVEVALQQASSNLTKHPQLGYGWIDLEVAIQL